MRPNLRSGPPAPVIVLALALLLAPTISVPGETAHFSDGGPTTAACGGRAAAGALAINEYLAKPGADWNGDGAANDSDEWVELYNADPSEAADLSGFCLDDIVGGSPPYFFVSGTSLKPSGFLVLYRNATGIDLDDRSDSVRLIAPGGIELNNLTYLGPKTDRSFGRLPDGTGLPMELYPTPGAPNVDDDPPSISRMDRDPEDVHPGQDVTVSAHVSDDHGVASVRLLYSLNGTPQPELPMADRSGIYEASLPGQPEGRRVSYFARATDTRGQETSAQTASYTVLPPGPSSLRLTAACDLFAYKPGQAAAVVGTVRFDTGEPASGAEVSAVLWGGQPLGRTFADLGGGFRITFNAPYDVGNFSIAVAASSGKLTAFLEVPIVILYEPNRPPELSEVSLTPRAATSRDDVMVCATIRDNRGVRAAWLAYRTYEPNFTRLMMNLTAPDRYIGRIPRQAACVTVEYYLEAWDGQLSAFWPPGGPQQPDRYTVLLAAAATGFLRLTAALNCTACLIGRTFLASGQVVNESGGAVARSCVTVSFEGHPEEPAANGTTDDSGIFSVVSSAPLLPGDRTVRLQANFGALSNFTFIRLRVRDILQLVVLLTNASLAPSAAFDVAGRVLRSDGSPASGASLELRFANESRAAWSARASADGAFGLSVRAPDRPGKWDLVVNASLYGVNETATALVTVQAPPRAVPGPTAFVAFAAAALALALRPCRRPTLSRP